MYARARHKTQVWIHQSCSNTTHVPGAHYHDHLSICAFFVLGKDPNDTIQAGGLHISKVFFRRNGIRARASRESSPAGSCRLIEIPSSQVHPFHLRRAVPQGFGQPLWAGCSANHALAACWYTDSVKQARSAKTSCYSVFQAQLPPLGVFNSFSDSEDLL